MMCFDMSDFILNYFEALMGKHDFKNIIININ